MNRDVVVRRIVHMLLALAPIYYLFPVELTPYGIRRWVLLVVFIGAIIAFEIVRLAKGITFLGLRPHEKDQIASFVWAAAGIVLTLWLFPQEIASAAIVGMALVDPLLGELRRSGAKDPTTVSVSALAYFAISFSVLFALGPFEAVECLALASIGALLAIPSEWFEVPFVDDDFLMPVIPALGMTALSLLL